MENKKELEILGWNASEKNIYFSDGKLDVEIKPNCEGCLKMYCTFEFNEEKLEDMTLIIKKTVETVLNKIPYCKVSFDISVSVCKEVIIEKESFVYFLNNIYLQELNSRKGHFRDFEIIKKRNITTCLDVEELYKRDSKIKFSVSLDNISMLNESIDKTTSEIVYFFYKQYIRLFNDINCQYQKRKSAYT